TLIQQSFLEQLWRPCTLTTGRRGGFAAGWEIDESRSYRHVGHDGGAQVRVRLSFKDTLDGDSYTFIYLTHAQGDSARAKHLYDQARSLAKPLNEATGAD
ncbi:MAG: serine hydrolase, partial [Cystobacter sp.]